MPQASAKYTRSVEPKSSMLRTMDATGQLTAPQNTQMSPIAAAKPAGMASSEPMTLQRVAPLKKVGTTSPPLKPQPMVIAVRMSFQKKASGFACPSSMARLIIFMPAPL